MKKILLAMMIIIGAGCGHMGHKGSCGCAEKKEQCGCGSKEASKDSSKEMPCEDCKKGK